MFRKHNIGRISFFLILINIIFVSIYLSDKNNNSFAKQGGEEQVRISMEIFKDETVDGEYVQILENFISDQQYSKDDLNKITTYSWYLTDNLATCETYQVDETEKGITIYAADDGFIDYLKETLIQLDLNKKGF